MSAHWWELSPALRKTLVTQGDRKSYLMTDEAKAYKKISAVEFRSAVFWLKLAW